MNIILIYFAVKYKGDWDKIYKALEEKEKPKLEDLQKIEKTIEESNYKVITIIDQAYPVALKRAYKPPFVLWIKGDVNLLKKKIICVTGNKVDKLTKERIYENNNVMNQNYEIIIPGFKGVDEELEKSFTKPIIKILARGLTENTSNNLLITEYPPNVMHPEIQFFRNRNRIIAGFADQLVLFSSDKNGKINHLVSAFLNIGKEINCFPGDGKEEDGNSDLIKQGANLVTTIKELY